MKTVIIASQNPAKIKAVKHAFQLVFEHSKFNFIGIDSPSGVSEQPMSDTETKQGALNRVHNAQSLHSSADFYVAIEAGFEAEATYAWIIIHSAQHQGESRSASLPLPERVTERLIAGEELGNVMDDLYATQNIKQKGGAISLLTNGLLTRSSVYQQALILALTRFSNPED